MTELEKIEYAKGFMDKLANGINPLDGTPIPDGDIVNNVRLSRCFFYVSDILRRVIENGGTELVRTPKSSKPKKKTFELTEAERSRIVISDVPVTVSEITHQLNALIDLNTVRKISTVAIHQWLIQTGLIEVILSPIGKRIKRPTEAGQSLGISVEERVGAYGTYSILLYDAQAQQLIFDHLEAIMALKKQRRESTDTFDEEDEQHQ